MTIQIPYNTGVQIYEFETSYNWFDDEGIFYSVAKKAPRSLEQMKASAEMVKDLFKGEKHCAIVESSNLQLLDKPTRLLVNTESKKLYKAIAIVSSTPMARAAGNIVYSFKQFEVPKKVFTNVEDAQSWIRIYL